MRITVEFEVENKDILREILQTGKAYSLLDYQIINFKTGQTK